MPNEIGIKFLVVGDESHKTISRQLQNDRFALTEIDSVFFNSKNTHLLTQPVLFKIWTCDINKPLSSYAEVKLKTEIDILFFCFDLTKTDWPSAQTAIQTFLHQNPAHTNAKQKFLVIKNGALNNEEIALFCLQSNLPFMYLSSEEPILHFFESLALETIRLTNPYFDPNQDPSDYPKELVTNLYPIRSAATPSIPDANPIQSALKKPRVER